MKIISLVLALVLLSSLQVFADSISIDYVSVSPNVLEPGDTATVTVRLENTGDDDIENVRVALDLSNVALPFVPVESASQKVISEIQDDESEQVTFLIKVASDAPSQLYKIPILISYKENELPVSDSTVIGLEVKSAPVLEVALEESEVYKLNQAGQVTVRFVNKGLSDIKFLSAKIVKQDSFDVLSTESLYVGNIQPDDFETVAFELNFAEKVSNIKVEVEYRDTSNKLYKKTYTLPIQLYTQEEAYRIGLEKKSNPYVIIVPVIIVILLIVFWRIRKRRRNK